MEIVLIRHGKSIVDTSGNVNAREFAACAREYDDGGVCEHYPPSQETIDRVAMCKFAVCSNLPRSIHSAKLLGIEKPDLISPLFRECEMPYTDWKFPKLPKSTWPAIFRVMQILGYSPNAESYKQAQSRSKQCTYQLQQLSCEHGSVLLVGHGALIWLLHKQLIKTGWLAPKKSVRKNWEYGVYRYCKTQKAVIEKTRGN